MNRYSRIAGATAIALGFGLGAHAALQGTRAQTTPTLRITAPADGATLGNPVSVSVQSTGANIKAASAGDLNSQHFHYFIDKDPAGILKPGEAIPSGQPDIIHSAETTLALPSLAPGKHTVWLVLGKVDHTPLSPNVQAQASFTVGVGAAQATPTPGARPATPAGLPANGDDFSIAQLLALGGAIVLVVGGYALIRFNGRQRS